MQEKLEFLSEEELDAVHVGLEAELTLASAVFEVNRDAIVIMDSNGIVRKVNPAFSTTTGFAPEDILGQFYPQWVNADGLSEVDFELICPAVKSGKHWQGELMQRRKSGERQAVWQTMLSVCNDAGEMTHFIAIETDMSAYKAAQAKVHFLSHYDSLTGMANRTQLEHYIGHELSVVTANQHSFAVICIDIDDFKKVNLSLGHSLGDQLLSILALRLERMKLSDGLWARLSGDEFVFAFVPENQTQLMHVMQQITERFSEPFALAEQKIRLTASLGIALYPQDAADSESLLRNAQSAMRAQKQAGGNGARFYTAKMNEQAVERLLLENQLAQAVSLGQLVLHYQPQISLITGKIIGFEALVRWQHPVLGLVMPGYFIPLAEETGLIEEIGDWVLVEACQQAVSWLNMGIDMVPMAVNVSAPQFMRQPIRDRVAQVLAETGLPAQWLELELTERIVMHDPVHVRQTLEDLAALGVILSLDDFGTGYSSLSYLQKFPLDKLKIDMSFVRNIASSRDDLAIAKAIIQLGKTMELTVIAEGIETIEQEHLLAQAGCEEGQGYYYAKPLPAERITTLLMKPISATSWPFS
jgi:diguanylate cyclase (GGDEF)-like protein/PAS domain S-box-containing protein